MFIEHLKLANVTRATRAVLLIEQELAAKSLSDFIDTAARVSQSPCL